jgi:hypothetical protein
VTGIRWGAVAFLALAMASAWAVDEAAQIRAIVADRLMYPRQARLTLPSPLPPDAKDAVTVTDQLRKAGLVRTKMEDGRTLLEAADNTSDVIVPATNLRYEITALNVVLGRWDISVNHVTRTGDVVVAVGRRTLVQRTRAYELVTAVLPPSEARKYADRDATWRITGEGSSLSIAEELR